MPESTPSLRLGQQFISEHMYVHCQSKIWISEKLWKLMKLLATYQDPVSVPGYRPVSVVGIWGISEADTTLGSVPTQG